MEVKSWEYTDPVSELVHYGIPGMKWGIVRTPEQLRSDAANKQARLDMITPTYDYTVERYARLTAKEEDEVPELERKIAQLEAKAKLEEANVVGETDEVKIAKAMEKAAKYREKAAKYRKRIAQIKTDWATRKVTIKDWEDTIKAKKDEIDSLLKTAKAVEDGTIERGHSILTQHFMKYK